MKPLVFSLFFLFVIAALVVPASTQTLAPSSSDKAGAQLEALTKKIDEQNTKIDALSQQILKLEQQLSTIRPGVMIGESTPPPSSNMAAAPAATPATQNGNAHVVTRGETLTAIAKAHRVSVQDLQKFNHIENDRALQIGQTIMIPPSAATSPTASPNE
ncbi:MAG: LysM peptidoglycan-binding domain-containing protein [Verrucomicrobiota bacterium]|nr:LysM peptidoglycan-binding domain-containing protein [Verrucomicrobiota bacterium]